MKMNVHNKLIASQYNIISKVFDNSRVRIWNNVKQFLLDDQGRTANTLTANTLTANTLTANTLTANTLTANTLLDCGCGNGKNMIYAQSLGYHSEGFDISDNLLDICKNKGLNVYYQDVLNLKANKKYNKIISIAVLHHLQTFEEQIAAIKILCDCLDNNGKLLVSFWSKEKTLEDIKEYRKGDQDSQALIVPDVRSKSDSRDFVSGPNYVSWKLDRENIIQRFYYIHDYKSIQELAKNINVKYTISWEQQNWFILFTKDI
jgi:cyclopropane fatty-acyl-phospholipid synthase-like methyltransferase